MPRMPTPESGAAAPAPSLLQYARGLPGAQVYLIGLGLPEKGGCTLEALEAMGRCRRLFVPDPEEPFFRRFGASLEPHRNLSRPRDRAACVERLLRDLEGGPVGFAIYGHPLFFEPIAEDILRECRLRGVTCLAVNGVSAVDAVLSALGQPLGFGAALTVADIRHFERHEVGRGQAALIFKAAMETGSREELVQSLVRSRSRAFQVAVVECRNFSRSEDRVEWVALGDLPEALRRPASLYVSIFVPPWRRTHPWRALFRPWIRFKRVALWWLPRRRRAVSEAAPVG